MSKIQKKLDKWESNTPKFEPKDSVLSVLDRYFTWRWEGGSHIVCYHKKLENVVNYFNGEFTVVVQGGQRVKAVYLKNIIDAIKIIEDEFREEI